VLLEQVIRLRPAPKAEGTPGTPEAPWEIRNPADLRMGREDSLEEGRATAAGPEDEQESSGSHLLGFCHGAALRSTRPVVGGTLTVEMMLPSGDK
jgi:hypothetical protein